MIEASIMLAAADVWAENVDLVPWALAAMAVILLLVRRPS